MLFKIPSLILRQLYTYNSLKNTDNGIGFSMKNRLTDAKIVGFHGIKVNGKDIETSKITLDFGDQELSPEDITVQKSVDFPLRKVVDVYVEGEKLKSGKHQLEISFQSETHGKMSFSVEDGLSEKAVKRRKSQPIAKMIIPKKPSSKEGNLSKSIQGPISSMCRSTPSTLMVSSEMLRILRAWPRYPSVLLDLCT
jgi:hypothetical protein